MARLDMQKVRIAVPRSEVQQLFALLHNFSHFEIARTEDESLTETSLEDFEHRHRVAQLDTTIEFLNNYYKASFFRALFEGSRVHTSLGEVEKAAREYDAQSTISAVRDIETKLNKNEASGKALEQEAHTLFAWARLELPLEQVQNTRHVRVFPIRGTVRSLEALRAALEGEELVNFETIDESAVLLVCHESIRESVEQTVRESELEIAELPQYGETAEAALKRVEEKQSALALERTELEVAATAIANKELTSLKKVADHALWHMQEIDAAAERPHTAYTAIVDGWVPARHFAALEGVLDKALPNTALEKRAPEEGEEIPIELKNSGFFNAFETITRLYGVPSHKDLDPTPFLSIFFFLFFGFCLSDTGYGAILMTLTGIVLLKYKLEPGMKQLISTLFFGGVGAFFFGMLFGGYLGVAPGDIHPALVPLQLFDPINNPLPVFYLALTFGVIHVSFGIILDILRNVKSGNTITGLLDNVPWLLMFVTFGAAILAMVDIFPASVNAAVGAAWSNVAIALAVVIMITKGRHGNGVFGKIVTGVLSLYGGVGYFADILSYSRLLALGLATGALAFSINLIAGFIGGETLGISTIFMIMVLIFGHTLNIVLSTLGAFINSARLQFVEFFSKFLQGTGRPFDGFKKDERNVILLPDTPM